MWDSDQLLTSTDHYIDIREVQWRANAPMEEVVNLLSHPHFDGDTVGEALNRRYEPKAAVAWCRKHRTRRDRPIPWRRGVHPAVTAFLGTLCGCFMLAGPVELPPSVCAVQIQDDMGRPVRGAQVFTRRMGQPSRVTLSDENGYAVIQARGEASVIVLAHGCEVDSKRLDLRDGMRVAFTTVPAKKISVIVRDFAGLPVSGALVEIRGGRWAGHLRLEQLSGMFQARSGEDGTVTFPQLYDGEFEILVNGNPLPSPVRSTVSGDPVEVTIAFD